MASGRELDCPPVAAAVQDPRPGVDGAGVEAPIPVRRLQAAPLSPAQRRVWCLARLEDGPTALATTLTLRLDGQLILPALEAALAEVLAGQTALRSVIVDRDGEPWQTVRPLPRPVLSRHDLEHEAEPAAAFALAATALARRPFDLARGPLLRAGLFFLGPGRYGLALSAHRLVADRPSLELLLGQVAGAYARHCRHDQMAAAPEPPLGYPDYAAWELARADRPQLAEAMAAGAAVLRGAPPLLGLPLDRPRPAVRSGRGHIVRFTVPADLARAVAVLDPAGGVLEPGLAGPFTPWLALWALLLGRLAGQPDVVLACPVSRRPPGTEDTAGLFQSPAVLRLRFEDNPGLARYLETSLDMARIVLANQEASPEALLRELAPHRSLAHAPLFQAAFQWRHRPPALPDLPGLDLTPVFLDTGTAILDLDLSLEPGPDGTLTGLARYAADLFAEATITRWIGHFLTLARAAVSHPETRVLDLPLLTPAEEARVIGIWSGAAVPAPPAAPPLPGQLLAACRRFGDRIALTDAEGETTYAALEAWSRAIAAGLGRLGPGRRVGVALPRSRAWVAALWGVWRSGATFVSLDPTVPPRRLELLAGRADLHVLVASPATTIRLGRGPWTYFDARHPCLGPEPFADREIGPDDTAYVVFTSGTSGAPKGICVSQAALAFHARAVARLFKLVPEETVLQFASPAFDVAMEEIWPTLVSGGRLAIGPAAVRQSPEALTAFCRTNRVAVANLPARIFEAWAEYLTEQGLAVPPDLRLLVTGSESVSSRALAAWRVLPGGNRGFLCGYGPSETTVTATFYDPDRDGPPTAPGPLPLGKPLAGVRAYVLDERRGPVPPGCVGYLHLAGPDVAQGYLHADDDTARGFQDDPFCPGTPMYRPGDRARLVPPAEDGPGLLLFEGRSDLQIKRRGFRIEPQEIEAVLAARDGVALAVVVARPDGRLMALVAPEPQRRPEPEALLAALAETLPAYMLPETIRVVDRLPLLPSGKPDRLAAAGLAAAEQQRPEKDVPPHPGVQRVLADIWATVLGRDDIARQDNFFSLGGDSYQALRVVGLAARAGVALAPRDLFLARTLAELAGLARPLTRG
jgi:surfactin family lipopeptide synthetase A